MVDKIEELKETMRHVEQLVLRFEIDMAAGLYVIEYHATIAQLTSSVTVSGSCRK